MAKVEKVAISVQVAPHQKAYVKQQADKVGMGLSEFSRAVLEKYSEAYVRNAQKHLSEA